ncbi:hypothetical protein Cgig2_031638 [Carnegiea gigantea]|uniref:Uncharacterized protein n=1 Tax=Carnegiea gigantea TaxID=171969 RepID=A0A9Q1QDV4_9CARY|nr:hypothetical protein Cgig2_031638 [Carnegiea gigantea]
MEVENSTRPIPTFDYVPTPGYEPSHRHAPIKSHHRNEEMRDCFPGERWTGAMQNNMPNFERPAKSTMTLATYATHSHRTACRVTIAMMKFDGLEASHFTSPHNDPLVVEMKVASAIDLGGYHHIRIFDEAQTPEKRDHPFGTPYSGLLGGKR